MKATEDKNAAIAQVRGGSGKQGGGLGAGGRGVGGAAGPGQGRPHAHTRPPVPCRSPAPPQAEKTSRKAQLAERLINGLSGENTRWNTEIKRMEVRTRPLFCITG
jgi:hypothetical protein